MLENLCAGVSFLIKLHAEKLLKTLEVKYQYKMFDKLVFFLVPLITKSKIFARFTQCALTHNW